jgi:uncharacterized membrane protein
MKQCPKCSETIKGKTNFCPSCGSKVGRQTTGEKKSRLTEEKKSGKMPFLAVGALVLFGGLAVAGWAVFQPSPTPVGASLETGASQGVTVPVSTFDDGEAKHFSYQAPSGKTIKFFALKSSDGVIRAAFDACDVCYQSKKGYRQEGDFMVCNNCGQRFSSVRVNEVKGGCNPSPLERNIEGENLVIAVADILTGAKYF